MANAAQSHELTRSAWTLFWADSAQSRCASGNPVIWQALQHHWSSFACTLPPSARVLDLGCGAGAVGRLLLAARADLRITGIDSARVPGSNHPQLALLSDTRMESLPFGNQSFGAVVSQFGYEYSQVDAAAGEIGRVLAPGAKLSMLVHHAQSAIVCASRQRLSAVAAFLAPAVRDAFRSGDAPGLRAEMSLLIQQYPDDALIAELARALPSRVSWARERRVSTWEALEDALAPESCVSKSLHASCVEAPRIGEWLVPLNAICKLAPVDILREPDGTPIAWRTEGVRPA
jgi:SAM-dependent methyltransferase